MPWNLRSRVGHLMQKRAANLLVARMFFTIDGDDVFVEPTESKNFRLKAAVQNAMLGNLPVPIDLIVMLEQYP